MVELNLLLSDYVTALRLRGYTATYTESEELISVNNKDDIEVDIQLNLSSDQRLSIEFYSETPEHSFVGEVSDLFQVLINNHLKLA